MDDALKIEDLFSSEPHGVAHQLGISLLLACLGSQKVAWVKGGVREGCFPVSQTEFGTALSDSLRNLFTCGTATNNCRVYMGQKTTSPSGSHTT